MSGESRPSSDQTRYRLLIDSIPYGFYSVDVEGRITDANRALADLLHYPLDELVGSLFHRLVPEDELERAERLLRQTARGEASTSEFEIRVVRGDGKRCLFQVAQRGLLEDGVVVGGHGIVRDVTDERETEERLRHGEQRLRLLLDRMPALLWTVDRELRFTSGSGGGLETLGLQEDELVGMTLYDYFGTTDPDHAAIRAHRRALEGIPDTFGFEWQERAYEVRVEPVQEEGGTVGAIGAALDVTERLQTKRKLEEQRAHWQRLFEAAPEGIVLLDSEDRIIQSNPEFSRLFGYSAEEARGRRINDLIVPPDRLGEASGLSRRVAEGDRISAEAIRRRKDGTLFSVSILGTPVDAGGEALVYGIYRDVTEQKTLQAQLLHSQRLEAVGQLAGGIAHDFNNILTAILGHARILATEVPEGWIRDDLREIESAAERAATLTRQLLTFSRRDVVSLRNIDVSEVVEGMFQMLTRLIGDHVQLEIALDPSLPAVSMDSGQLEQVVMNLVINARDSMPDGGRVRVKTSLLRPGGRRGPAGGSAARATAARAGGAPHVVLEVADSGTGMTEEERTRMFEPFFTTKGAGKGTGLGLSTVYGIVDQSGGWIDVESEKGKGTVIRVYIPAVAERAEPAAAPGPSAGDPSPGANGAELVLLVDDDGPVRNISRQILERHGYTVTAAGSGNEALELARSMDAAPDLLLTDIVMPGMTGQTLAAEIRGIFPDTAILFMSGYTESDLTEGLVASSHFIAKPFDPSTLVRRVREALG